MASSQKGRKWLIPGGVKGLGMEEGVKVWRNFWNEFLKTQYFLNILTNEGGVETGFCSAEQANFNIWVWL